MLSEKSNLSISKNSGMACMIVHEDVNLGRGEFVIHKPPILELEKFAGVYYDRGTSKQHFSYFKINRVTMLYTGVCTNGQNDIIGEKGNSIKLQSLHSETARGSDKISLQIII
jgi:hypothetical protein